MASCSARIYSVVMHNSTAGLRDCSACLYYEKHQLHECMAVTVKALFVLGLFVLQLLDPVKSICQKYFLQFL